LRDLATGEPLGFDRISDIAVQCCEGLQAAHDVGILHRDIKSSNIMLDKYGTVKILDFGLAKIASEESITQTSGIQGTYQFMSPEQITGQTIDHRSDLFSLGVVLYEVITGHLPFEGNNVAAVAYEIVHSEPGLLSKYREHVPTELETAVARALSKELDDRCQSAKDLKAIIRGTVSTSIPTVKPPAIRSQANGNTIAVFPFRSLGGDADDNYLSEGISEDLITAIVKVPGLSAASQSAIKRLLKRELDAVEIARELHAAHFLEGTLRRQGKTIRLNIQLTRSNDEIVVWSDGYERRPDDVFSLQQDIATQIAASLNITLTGSQTTVPAGRPDVDPEAYELYLQGKYHLKRRDEGSMVRAVNQLYQAVQLDSDFAAGYGELAIACQLCETYGYECPGEISGRAYEFANKALDLDPGSSLSHISVFHVLRHTDIRRAVSEVRTAIALDGSNAEAYHYLGHTLMFCGHYRSAEDAELAAISLDPFMEMSDANLCMLYFLTDQEDKLETQKKALVRKYGQSHVVGYIFGWMNWCLREWKTAAEHYAKSLSIEHSDYHVIERLADCYCRQGNASKAFAILESALVKNPKAHMLHARLGRVLSSIGETDKATREFETAAAQFEEIMARSGGEDSALSHYHRGWLLALRDDEAAALQHLRASAEKGFGNYAELRKRPDWELLQSEDDFRGLIRELEEKKLSEDRP
jgi:serine/threonine-protein kinase